MIIQSLAIELGILRSRLTSVSITQPMNSEFSPTRGASILQGQTVVVFDLEYTAWEGSLERNWNQGNETAEIIQIGAVEICSDAGKWSMHREFNQYVKPTLKPELSDYIMELTGISQQKINEVGVSFPTALEYFLEFCPEDVQLCANGDDWNFLELNCRTNKIENPLRRDKFVNVRPFIARQLAVDENSDNLHSHRLPHLLNSLDTEHAESHNALVDARTIADALIYITHSL